MAKKILIVGAILVALVYSGTRYFRSSQIQHSEFLAEQGLFPDFTQWSQQQNHGILPRKVYLRDGNFILMITPPTQMETREENRQKILEWVQKWTKHNSHFNELRVQVYYEGDSAWKDSK